MMWILLLFVGGSISALVLLYLFVRARDKRLLLGVTHAASCDAPDCIGISVLCSGVMQVAQVEHLLSAEYSRYEVVVVLDSHRYPAEFAALRARYRMIGVEYLPTWEFPAFGIRELGRSRRRGFRRLVLVDRAQDTPNNDFDAAAGVASYDYLLPLYAGQYLMADAIERFAAEVGESPAGEVELVRSWVGEPVALFGRDAVANVGGFSRHPARRIPADRCRTLWEPLCCVECSVRRFPRWLRGVVALLLVVVIGAAVVVGRWELAAAGMTLALVWCAAAYLRQLVDEVAGPCFPGLVAWRQVLRKFTL